MTTTPKKLAQVNIPTSGNVFNITNSTYNIILPLTSTTALAIYNNGTTNGSARVMTLNAGGIITYGDIYVFNAAQPTYISAVLLDATHALIAYTDTGNSSYGTALIATISGNSISYGSKYVFHSGGDSYISTAMISSTSVFIAYSTGTVSNGIIATITGTTIAYGTLSQFTAVYSYNTTCIMLDSTHVFIGYSQGAVYGIVGTISGNSITGWGTSVIIESAGGVPSGSDGISITLLSSTSIFMCCKYSSSSAYSIIINIAGTVVTYGSRFTFNGRGTSHISTALLSSMTAIISFNDATLFSQSIVATISGNNITHGRLMSKLTTAAAAHSTIAVLTPTIAIINAGVYVNSVTIPLTINELIISSNGVPTTICTGATDHTEISSIYISNTGTSDSIITLLAGGSGGLDINVIRRVIVPTNGEIVSLLANCPIILSNTETLRAYHDSQSNITITCYGLEITV